jgi:DNA-binding transcriptional regulator YiaG
VPDLEGEASTKFRFSAKRLAAQRQKLGLSAGDMGALIGVSAQTIYNWEAEKSRPRQSQLASIAAVRKMGKRAIKAQLESQAQ